MSEFGLGNPFDFAAEVAAALAPTLESQRKSAHWEINSSSE
jgi:hypothetical protein